MKVSVCLTIFNEEKTIFGLLDSLLCQTKKPQEIVIVDGGSRDGTVEIIRHFQKKDRRIRLLVQKCTRSEGRNIAVELAKNEIIAITDAGCVADKNWLDRIIEPFNFENVDIVAGFYKMTGDSPFQKAASIFLGVSPSKFDVNFLPSTRSIAFRKKSWEKAGGFPEDKENSAEDTYFNYNALKLGMKYIRVKNAIVGWGMPRSLGEFWKKISAYAKWDARSGVWFFPKKGLASHNIKALSIFARYLLATVFLILSFKISLFMFILVFSLIVYVIWSFRKTQNYWGVILQFVSDFAVMAGFIAGTISK